MRPTSDRLRETLFNVLGAGVRGSHFLDLCAGSGAVGIEALSRGARRTVFIEQSRRACAVIEANLRALDIATQAALVVCCDARAALKQLAADHEAFDLIFFDPPYESDLYSTVLSDLGGGALLNDDAVVVVEHRAKLPLEDSYGRLNRFRELKQGESALAFYRAE